MIETDKPSLPLCAFGAGVAHAAMLALVLPVMVTLPAPADKAQGTVAVRVAVASAAPEPAYRGEGDVDQAALPAPAPATPLPASDEITGALPEVAAPEALEAHAALPPAIESAAPAEPAEPAVPPKASLADSLPTSHPEADMDGETVASIESTEPPTSDPAPALVPMPLRKPALSGIREHETKPAPQRRVSRRPRPVSPARKGILGGTTATTMQEYPFAPR